MRPPVPSARATLLAAVLLCLATGQRAAAQPAQGFYVGGGVGYGLLSNQSGTLDAAPAPTTNRTAAFDGGAAVVGSAGYGLGNGLRVEVEGSYRTNDQRNSGAGHGSQTQFGVMANALFDLDLQAGWVVPYVGAGLGYQQADWRGIRLGVGGLQAGAPATAVFSQSVGGVAYQGILGAAFPLDFAPGLSATIEYRYLALGGTRGYAGSATLRNGAVVRTRLRTGSDANQAFLVGLRYVFNAADAGAGLGRPPLADTASPALATRTYLVVYDGDQAELTPRGRDTVAEAARASAKVTHTRIEVAGVGDAPAGADGLPLRRAQNVATEMQRYGVAASAIDLHAYSDRRTVAAGDTNAPPGARVEIVYR